MMEYIPQICATAMVAMLGIDICVIAITSYRQQKKSSVPSRTGGHECFHCGKFSVYWDGDFSFEDYGEEGEGIIHECTCSNCGARVTYRISCEPSEEDE